MPSMPADQDLRNSGFSAPVGQTTSRIFLPDAGSRGSPSVSVNDPHMSPL
jgi:hypothetical protein